MTQLQNNKLILNWHRIFNKNQLFEFFTKKFGLEVNSVFDIEKTLKNYADLNIAIWHSDTFLKDESKEKRNKIIQILEKHGTVKQTWKIKKYKSNLYF